MKVFIYALCDPVTGDVRYIGQTVDLERRYKQHLYRYFTGNRHLFSWLGELSRENRQPQMAILEVCDIRISGWTQAERKWITFGVQQRWPLLNVARGGDDRGGGRRGYKIGDILPKVPTAKEIDRQDRKALKEWKKQDNADYFAHKGIYATRE